MKFKNRIIYFSIIIIILQILINSCDWSDRRLRIANHSNNAICYEIQTDSFLQIPSINNKEVYLRRKVVPGDTIIAPMTGGIKVWEELIKRSKSKKLFIFFFNYDTLNQNNWDTLRKYRRFTKMYQFTTDELLKNNWLINFK